MARSASPASDISTNANPRDRPVSRSVTKLTRSTFPYGSNSARMEDSVEAKSKLPTKMFFIFRLLCLSIVRARRGDATSQVVAGLSKGDFSIAQRSAGAYIWDTGGLFVRSHNSRPDCRETPQTRPQKSHLTTNSPIVRTEPDHT